jgi:uncharacterized protein YeaO (DUF488 family)
VADIVLRRVYDVVGKPKQGPTFLVDRLWPRGVSKSDLDLDGWLRDLAPSTELRRWFGHDPDRFEEFRRRYLAEIGANREAAEPIIAALSAGPVVLLFSARDTEHNQAVVLREFLLDESGRKG